VGVVGGLIVKAILIPLAKGALLRTLALWIKRAVGIGQAAKP
jgi:hypothetical protein